MPGRILNMKKPTAKQIERLLRLADYPAQNPTAGVYLDSKTGEVIPAAEVLALLKAGWAAPVRGGLVITGAGLDVIEEYL